MKTEFGADPVLDRDHRLQGIVSRSEVVRKFSLEQTLAELADSDFDATLGVEGNDDALASIGAAAGQRLSNMKAKDIMVHGVATVGPDALLAEAADIMVMRRIHRLPVVEQGQLVGIISAFDFMRLYASEEASWTSKARKARREGTQTTADGRRPALAQRSSSETHGRAFAPV